MPEEGFSFFKIQTPLENLTPCKQKDPPESCKFLIPTPLFFSDGGTSYEGVVEAMKCNQNSNLFSQKFVFLFVW